MISFDVLDLLTKTSQYQQVQQATALNKQLQDTGRKLASIVEEVNQTKTYAEAAAVGKKMTETPKPNFTIVVSSTEDRVTSEDVLKRVRGAADARVSGVAVKRIRKARNQKVVISCASRETVDKLKGKLREAKELKVEEVQNRDPLITIKNVLAYNTDDEILESIKRQNGNLVGEIPTEDYRTAIRYRRKIRNPHECRPWCNVPSAWDTCIERGSAELPPTPVAIAEGTI